MLQNSKGLVAEVIKSVLRKLIVCVIGMLELWQKWQDLQRWILWKKKWIPCHHHHNFSKYCWNFHM